MKNKGKALPSANFVIDKNYDIEGKLSGIKISGGGFGHGVGMSQFGAGYMATTLKMPYEKILQHYYTGISLATEPFILSSNNEQNQITQSFFTKNKKISLIIDNKYKVSYIDTKINNINEKINLDKSQRLNKIDISNFVQEGLNTITFYYPAEEGNKGIRIYVEVAEADE
jgi:peptidoglycan hydrolase-like amidase